MKTTPKTATALKAKSRNLSEASATPSHIIQRNFFLERFIERAALSPYHNDFVIKGGMLISSIIGIDLRATVDLDATLRGRDLDGNDVQKIVNDVIGIDLGDNMRFTFSSAERTRVESDYPGWRVSLEVEFDKIRDTLKLDITTGDVITPRAVEYSYKLMFEDRSVSVLAYNLETVLAEKFTACIYLGTANTRMKDYYDIYILQRLRSSEIDRATLADALKRTSTQRRVSLDDCSLVLDEIADNDEMLKLWKRYLSDNKYAEGIQFADTIAALRTLTEWGQLDTERA
ncbi:MAG: nucleotidyl transferase AbiEii/AbiGii toxin family protein [Coriobacteriales bacterium]|jgi:predicted nucleotidyltransferase component of viral defense system|nr:nucleotidyl transferase AbiEii/AbiGii toxin family protein [Coriobacteriales bacterium]